MLKIFNTETQRTQGYTEIIVSFSQDPAKDCPLINVSWEHVGMDRHGFEKYCLILIGTDGRGVSDSLVIENKQIDEL